MTAQGTHKNKKMHAEITGEKIRAIAKELFFSFGLKSTSMDDLARFSGISKKTVYQYYPDKDALVHEVVMDQIALHERFLSSCQAIATDAIIEVLMRDIKLFGFWTDIPYSFFYGVEKYYPHSWQELENHSSKMRNEIIRNLDWGREDGLYRKDINVTVVAELYMYQHRSILKSQIPALQKINNDSLMMEMALLHLHSVATEKGKTLTDRYLKSEIHK